MFTPMYYMMHTINLTYIENGRIKNHYNSMHLTYIHHLIIQIRRILGIKAQNHKFKLDSGISWIASLVEWNMTTMAMIYDYNDEFMCSKCVCVCLCDQFHKIKAYEREGYDDFKINYLE